MISHLSLEFFFFNFRIMDVLFLWLLKRNVLAGAALAKQTKAGTRQYKKNNEITDIKSIPKVSLSFRFFFISFFF